MLKATFSFISPFVTRRSKSLSFCLEFIMILMKLRSNVPLQDLAYGCGVSLSTVSRPFSTWLTMTDIRRSPVLRWPEQDELRHTMPLCLQFSFGKNHHYYWLFWDLYRATFKSSSKSTNIFEGIIGLLRQKYSILQGALPINYLTCSEKTGKIPLIDRMIMVCAALTNLSPSVVPFE